MLVHILLGVMNFPKENVSLELLLLLLLFSFLFLCQLHLTSHFIGTFVSWLDAAVGSLASRFGLGTTIAQVYFHNAIYILTIMKLYTFNRLKIDWIFAYRQQKIERSSTNSNDIIYYISNKNSRTVGFQFIMDICTREED